jgi:CTP synthase (UTP-ammonia lyase)
MSTQYSVALVGDYNSSVPAHQAIPLALDLAAAFHDVPIHGTWFPTASVQDAATQFKSYQGIWCVPASPYQNTQGALSAIRFARENGLPFLGTCGGFQHALLEYARNVLGIADAAHAETDPEGPKLLIAPLRCSLVETRAELLLEPGSILSKSYGEPRVVEGYRCSYGPNPEYEDVMFAGDLWVTARDLDGEVRAGELRNHPFFVGTLFQPERWALEGELPPLVREFTRAILAGTQTGNEVESVSR